MSSIPSNGISKPLGNLPEKDPADRQYTSSTNGLNNNDDDDDDVSEMNVKTSNSSSTITKEISCHDDAVLMKHPHRISKPSAYQIIRNSLFRLVCLDIPFIIILGIYLSIVHLHWLSYNYLLPLNTLQYFDTHERDITYYHRICTRDDQTTYDTEDLLVDIRSSSSRNDTTSIHTKIDIAVQKMLRHGVTILPNLISESTATALRDYILEQNKINDHLIFVIENQFRWSFPIQVDQDPIISQALQEILVQNNPNLIPYLEAVMGTNPAIIEFTAITQAYGAKEQFWHQDVVPSGSAVKYGRKYIPSYSLFIPLQNVTAEMGATGICPGTHMCAEADFCSETGFQTSGKSNNWPLGYGAFVNQQTTHRGSAHRDPHGPHRVVFILTFAPRPLTFKPYRVETRLIGSGGSYSLHWSQWGHTVYDYQDPLQRMKQPYRTLRSLGLYNPYDNGSTNWGWDYITVSSARIANEDVGFTSGDFEDFLSKGGFTWLPKRLQGNATMPSEEDETSYGWLEFLLETVSKCKVEITRVYYTCLVGYVGCILLFALLSERGCRVKSLIHNAFRLCVIHVALLSAAWVLRHNVINSSWGRNVQAQRSFRLSNTTLAMAPSLPATLPTDDDVLIFEAMQSESFSSFSRVLDVFHPGNRVWNDLVDQMSPLYDRLSSTLQTSVRYHILKTIEKESRRLLIQTDQSDWGKATPEIRHLFCHKSLLQKSNHYLNDILQRLDNILSDIRYGYWRDTRLYQKHVSRFVYSLRNDIMQMQYSARRQPISKKEECHDCDKILVSDSLFVARPYVGMRMRHATLNSDGHNKRSRSILSAVPTQDFFPLSWLSVGDVAEASFVDDITEWYRCTIKHASANRGVWDVIYDDGDDANDLCRTCVRPFIPYAVNETIDVLLGPDRYEPCHVVAVHHTGMSNDMVYDVQLDNGSNKVISNVPTKGLRRNYKNDGEDEFSTLPALTRVMALYRDDDGNAVDYFPGRIIQYNTNRKSYDVEFDDGDVAYNIRRYDIELMAQSSDK